MQLLVILSQDGGEVHAVYDDTAVIPVDSFPNSMSVLRYVDSKYVVPTGDRVSTLDSAWRESIPQITSSEGARRIEQCFTAAQQRAASLLVQNDMMQYGNDTSAWPSSEQTRYSEVQRGLAYITAMNAAADAIVAQGVANPCDDQYWPAPIDPIQL